MNNTDELIKLAKMNAAIDLAREILNEDYETVAQVRGHLYNVIGKIQKELDNEPND